MTVCIIYKRYGFQGKHKIVHDDKDNKVIITSKRKIQRFKIYLTDSFMLMQSSATISCKKKQLKNLHCVVSCHVMSVKILLSPFNFFWYFASQRAKKLFRIIRKHWKAAGAQLGSTIWRDICGINLSHPHPLGIRVGFVRK